MMDNLMDTIKKEAPTHYGELMSSLNTCITNITAIRTILKNKSQQYNEQDLFDDAMHVTQANKRLKSVENELIDIVENMTNPSINEQQKLSSDILAEGAKTNCNVLIDDNIETVDEKTDYSKYLVDNTIAYPVSSDLENTTPYSFSFLGNTYRVSNYLQMWVKVCELLYNKDQKIFENIAVSHSLAGRKKAYIVYKGDAIAKNMTKPITFLDTDIILEGNSSTTQKCNIILNMLGIYKIPVSSMKVYLESDRRPKHGQKPIGKYINLDHDYTTEYDDSNTQTADKPEVKIAQLAYSFFTEYFKDTNKRYDIDNFLNEKWCFEVLGIACPLLKEIDENVDLKEQTFYGDKNYPSYAQNPKYFINGKTYLICMRWFEIYRDKLEKWISDQKQSKNSIQKHIKENCVHFDFKKNICGCVANEPVFNQPCSHAESCKYYSDQELYVISKKMAKEKICPCCGGKCKNQMVKITYTKENKSSLEVTNRLATLRCECCEKDYINEDVFKNYVKNKSLSDLSAVFIEVD